MAPCFAVIIGKTEQGKVMRARGEHGVAVAAHQPKRRAHNLHANARCLARVARVRRKALCFGVGARVEVLHVRIHVLAGEPMRGRGRFKAWDRNGEARVKRLRKRHTACDHFIGGAG